MQKSTNFGEVKVQTMPISELKFGLPLKKLYRKRHEKFDEKIVPAVNWKSLSLESRNGEIQKESRNMHDNKRDKTTGSSKTKISLTASNKSSKFITIKRKSLPESKTPKFENATKNRQLTQSDKRRVANARERTRVHALSSAFNSLRKAIPRYSANQRLSKLTILRVAINYIAALDALNRDMGSSDVNRNFQQNVDLCTKALQSEYGRTKKRGCKF